jgi:hypothetical protein
LIQFKNRAMTVELVWDDGDTSTTGKVLPDGCLAGFLPRTTAIPAEVSGNCQLAVLMIRMSMFGISISTTAGCEFRVAHMSADPFYSLHVDEVEGRES